MRKLTSVLVLMCVAAAGMAAQQAPTKKAAGDRVTVAGLPPGAASAMDSIDVERIRAHVKFLSHDLLEGRGTGQRGGDIAAQYLATQLELYGLKPAGENGTFLQKVALIGVQTDPQGTTFALLPQGAPPMELRFADDYVVMNETQTPSVDVDAEMVFMGYGIEAPEFGWNDYAGVDVKGKVLLMLVNEPTSPDPKFFNGRALTYYGRWTYKYEQAARKGAAGVVLIHKTEMASYGWDVVRNSWSGERSYLRDDKEPGLKAASWVQLEVASKALAAVGKDVDQLMKAAGEKGFKPVPLPIRLKTHVVSKVRPFDSFNVLGKVEGSDPKLRDEAVVYSGHYDHLGIRPGKQGDNIYNGALDNATGCAILLEMARAWTLAKPRPKRSILFAFVTAEEQGLRGSEYLGQNPPIPAGKVQLALNYDDIKPYGVPEEVEVVGAERTTFYPIVQRTAREFRLKIMPDSYPEAGYYYRSDHFSFARVGIPAFSVNPGVKFRGQTSEWGEQKNKEYTAKDYHQPSDEYREEFDFSSNSYLAKFGFALGWRAANQPGSIGWQKGDEFERARMQSLGGTE